MLNRFKENYITKKISLNGIFLKTKIENLFNKKNQSIGIAKSAIITSFVRAIFVCLYSSSFYKLALEGLWDSMIPEFSLPFKIVLFFGFFLCYSSNLILINLFVLTLAPKSYNYLFDFFVSLIKTQKNLLKVFLTILGITVLIFPFTFLFSSLFKTLFVFDLFSFGFIVESIYVKYVGVTYDPSLVKEPTGSQVFYSPIENKIIKSTENVSKLYRSPKVLTPKDENFVLYNQFLVLMQNHRIGRKIDPQLLDLKKYQTYYQNEFSKKGLYGTGKIINVSNQIEIINSSIPNELCNLAEETASIKSDKSLNFSKVEELAQSYIKLSPQFFKGYKFGQSYVQYFHVHGLSPKNSDFNDSKLRLAFLLDDLRTELSNRELKLLPEDVQSNTDIISKMVTGRPVQAPIVLEDCHRFSLDFEQKNNMKLIHKYLIPYKLAGGENSSANAKVSEILTDVVPVFKDPTGHLIFVSFENKHYGYSCPLDDTGLQKYMARLLNDKLVSLNEIAINQSNYSFLPQKYILSLYYKDVQIWAEFDLKLPVDPDSIMLNKIPVKNEILY